MGTLRRPRRQRCAMPARPGCGRNPSVCSRTSHVRPRHSCRTTRDRRHPRLRLGLQPRLVLWRRRRESPSSATFGPRRSCQDSPPFQVLRSMLRVCSIRPCSPSLVCAVTTLHRRASVPPLSPGRCRPMHGSARTNPGWRSALRHHNRRRRRRRRCRRSSRRRPWSRRRETRCWGCPPQTCSATRSPLRSARKRCRPLRLPSALRRAALRPTRLPSSPWLRSGRDTLN